MRELFPLAFHTLGFAGFSPAQATQLLWPSGFAKLRTWSFLVNIRLKRNIAKGKLSQHIINDNHIYYYVRTSIFHISSLGEIYLFLYNTVDQIFLRVREEDQVTLFGAKMLGFFRLKIETVPLLFSRMQTCFLKDYFLYATYCIVCWFFRYEFYVREKYSRGVLSLMPTVLNSRLIFSFILVLVMPMDC